MINLKYNVKVQGSVKKFTLGQHPSRNIILFLGKIVLSFGLGVGKYARVFFSGKYKKFFKVSEELW